MIEGRIIKVGTRKYKVLEILPRKFKEHDLILCEDLLTKTKECFQRFDIDAKINNERIPYPKEYKEIILEEHRKGRSKKEIAQMLFEREDNAKTITMLKNHVDGVIAGWR